MTGVTVLGTVDVGEAVFGQPALRMVLFVAAVTGIVLLVAGRMVGGEPGRRAMQAGAALALGAFLLTVVGWVFG
jgi:hypothetical protein